MYPSMTMMMTSQMNALTEAQPQPSASSSPNMARRRGSGTAGFDRCCHLPPYLTVSVPVIAGIGCTVQMNGYVPAARAG